MTTGSVSTPHAARTAYDLTQSAALVLPMIFTLWVLGCGDAASGPAGPSAGAPGTGDAMTGGTSAGTGGAAGSGGSNDTTGGGASGDSATGSGGSAIGGGGSGGAAGNAGSAPDGGGTPSASVFRVDGAALWRGNAKAAYTIIHDDLCDSSTFGSFDHADPLLVARGLRAGFGANPSKCNTESKWPAVKTLVSHGHDVFNHTWDHACIGDPGGCSGNMYSADLSLEIDKAGQLIQMQTGVTPQFFIFPYDVCGTTALAHLQQSGYLGARCGGQGMNPS